MGAIKEQIAGINARILDLQNLRKVVQDNCPHRETKDGEYSYRIGASMVANICTECGKILPPDDKES